MELNPAHKKEGDVFTSPSFYSIHKFYNPE